MKMAGLQKLFKDIVRGNKAKRRGRGTAALLMECLEARTLLSTSYANLEMNTTPVVPTSTSAGATLVAGTSGSILTLSNTYNSSSSWTVSGVTGYGGAFLNLISGNAGGSGSLSLPGNSGGTLTPGGTWISVGNPGGNLTLNGGVNRSATTTTLTALQSVSDTGQTSLILVAAVTGGQSPTGTVQFTDNQGVLGTAAVQDGVAILDTGVLAAGSYSIAAAYRGDNATAPSHAANINETIQADGAIVPTQTTLASPVTSSQIGDSIVLTANVGTVDPSGTPIAGNVVFFDASPTGPVAYIDAAGGVPVHGTILGTAAIVDGAATFTAHLALGDHTIDAIYQGDTLNVVDGNTVSLTSGSSDTYYPNQFNGNLVNTSAFGTLALTGGSVTTGTIDNSSADTGTPAPPTVALLGNSVSAPVTITVTHRITTTTITSTGDGDKFNPATITATITGTAPPMSGEVEFLNGTTVLATVPLTHNVISVPGYPGTVTDDETFSTAGLPVGTYSITAMYIGTSWDAPSTSDPLTQQVVAVPTATTLTADSDSTLVGRNVTFTAQVNPIGESGTITGSVAFVDTTTGDTLGTVSLTSGSAVLTIDSLAQGDHQIQAQYLGDSPYDITTSNFVLSDSLALLHTVRRGITTTVLTSSGPSTVAKPATLTATVTSPDGLPSGTVTFEDGTTVLATVNLQGNTAAFSAAGLAVGPHSLTAIYNGDPAFYPSTAQPIDLVVGLSKSTLQLLASANPIPGGTDLILTAAASSVEDTPLAPTGTVTFYDGTTELGSATLGGVTATSKYTLAPGVHYVHAEYSGDSTFDASQSILETETVQKGGVRSNAAVAAAQGANEESVIQIYKDFLHRAVDPSGLQTWTNAMAHGMSYNNVVSAITHSAEYDTDLVDALYMNYLGRHVDSVGISAWVGQLQAGGSIDSVHDGILASDEFFNRTGQSDQSYVSCLYQAMLQRDADASGLQNWVGQLGVVGRQAVVHAIGSSAEGQGVLVTYFYNTYLHRAPDAAGLAYWESKLGSNESMVDVVTGIMTSPEYLNGTESSTIQLNQAV
jgi:hypothetical protein